MLTHTKTRLYFLLALITPLIFTGCDSNQKAQSTISYSKEIIPILQNHCLECHVPDAPGEKVSGLNMSTHQALMKGTKFGPVIKPGDSLSSTLVILVEGRADPSIKMPHGDRPSLAADEIAKLRQWIDQGAINN